MFPEGREREGLDSMLAAYTVRYTAEAPGIYILASGFHGMLIQ